MHDETDAKKLLHELQVHQIELEMQSAELHLNQLETEKKLDHYQSICLKNRFRTFINILNFKQYF